ncbi:MAG: glycine/betaine ABC transporter substrate-binding protein [Acidimicrobiia bacterium]|nr:glycine/betaine ABC transporter substrate-binding protein [Acidimicrobiia bacterium]
MIKFRAAAAAALAFALVASACGDDDSDDASSTTTGGAGTTEAGAGSATFEFVPLDSSGPLTKGALRSGDIDIAVLFTSDADIAAEEWVLLEDDKALQPAENLIPAIREDKITPATEAALDAVSSELTTAELTEMNRQNTVDGDSPADVAKAWLEEKGIVPYEGEAVTGSLTVGSTNFAEQEIVAELYAQVLEAAGASVTKKFQLGAREIVAPALGSGEIDLYPEYIGSYTAFLDDSATVPNDSEEAADQLRTLLEASGVTVLAPAEAEDKNGFVVTQETADEFGLAAVSDLAGVSEALKLGGPPECPERPFCLIGLEDTYGLTFAG